MFRAPCGWGVGVGGWGWWWVDGGGGGWMGVVVGGWGWGAPTHVHMYVHACMHMHAHIHVKHDNFNCKWQPPLGESLGIPYDVIHTHACACMCMHVHMCGGHPLTTPPPHPPTHPPGGTPKISENSIALELIETFQFCLKIWNLWRLPYPWVGVSFGGWVDGGWVDGWGQVKTLKI